MFITGHFAGLPEFWDEFRREELDELMAELAATSASDTAGAAPENHRPTRHAELDSTAIAEDGTDDIAF